MRQNYSGTAFAITRERKEYKMSNLTNIQVQDVDHGNGADFYESFKQKLQDIEQFPTIYTFKFIVPALSENKAKIEAIFTHPSAKISSKESSTGKYNSYTIENFVNSADEVIEYYKKVAVVEKVIML